MRPEPMKQLALRIPADAPKRADALLPKLNALPEQRARGVLTRADVIRLALMYGLDLLERSLAQKRARRARG